MLSAVSTFAVTLALNALALFRETRLETISGKGQAGGATLLSHASTIVERPIKAMGLVSSGSIFISLLLRVQIRGREWLIQYKCGEQGRIARFSIFGRDVLDDDAVISYSNDY